MIVSSVLIITHITVEYSVCTALPLMEVVIFTLHSMLVGNT